MSAHVLLNLLNGLEKREKYEAWWTFYLFFRKEFNKFKNASARMLDSIYHMTLRLRYIFVIIYATVLWTS